METQLKNITMKETSKAADQEVSLVDSQMVEKHDDLNESFKKLLNKFGLKFKLKQGSSDDDEMGHVPEADTEEVPVESVVDSAITEQTMTLESESMCPTQGETREKVQQDTQTQKPDIHEEWTHIETTSEHDPASSSEEDVTMSPVKRFFTTGIFAVKWKKRQLEEDEIITRELVQQDAEGTAPDRQDETNEMNPCTDPAKDGQEEIPSRHPVTESKMSQETENIQASSRKRLLLKSNLIKLPRKPIDVELPGGCQLEPTGESDQLGSTRNLTIDPQKDNTAEVTVEEDKTAWATFIKVLSPKKRLNRSFLEEKDTEIMISREEEILKRSMEDSKKRRDSVVSWDSILCGSGSRRSNGPSDSDHETPHADHIYRLKNGVEETEISKDNSEILASSSKQSGSPVEVDGESPWNTFKSLLSPKRKAKREGVSESDMIHEDSSFSSKIFPGRKKRKSVTKKDQVASPREPDQNLSPDESEIPAIVPLSEFDAVEMNVEAKETNVERKVSNEPDQKILEQVTEVNQPLDDLQSVDTTVQQYLDNEARTNEDLAEFISNQLSDITEESEMTQTMATPESATQDLMSEAITAPLSADSTLANDSEMISANSHISEPLKTSGNTTPVPAEPEVKETERLMQQFVETIFTMPEIEPLINSSASDQILETFAQEELKPLEGNKSDVATTNEKDETPEMANISKVIEACSIESPPQIPNKVLDTVEMTINDVKEADLSQPANTTNKLYSFDKVHDYVACPIDVKGLLELLSNSKEKITGAAESKFGAADRDVQTLLDTIDKLPVKDHPHVLEGDWQKKRKQNEKSVQQVEKKVMLEDFPADEVKGKSDDLPGAFTEEPKPPKDILPKVVLDSAAKSEVLEKCIVEPVGDYIIPVTIKLEKATVPLPEVCAEPENKDDAEESVYASKKEISHEIKITEDLEAKELELDDTSIQAIKSKETSKTIFPKEKVRENLNKEEDIFAEVTKTEYPKSKVPPIAVEPENEGQKLVGAVRTVIETEKAATKKEQRTTEGITDKRTVPVEATVPVTEMIVKQEDQEAVDASKNEICQEIEVPEDGEVTKLESDDTNTQASKSEVESKNIFSDEKARGHFNEDIRSLAENNEAQEDKNTKVTAALEFEFNQEQKVLKAAQKSQLESGEVDDQAIHHKVLSEEIIAEECLAEQLKMETVPLPETKAVQEEKGHKAQDDEFQSELIKDVEQVQVNEDDVQLVKAEEISECRLTEKPVKCQVQDRSVSLTEVNVETIKQDMKNVDAATAKQQESLELVQSTDEIMKKIEAESLSTQRESYKVNVHLFDTKEEAIFSEETKTEYPKDKSEVPPTVDVEPENEGQKSEGVAKTEIAQEKVDTNKEQEATEGITEEGTDPVEETEPVTEMNVEQEDQEAVDVSKNEICQEIEVPKDGEATKLESDDTNIQASTSEAASKNIFSEEKAREDFNEDIRSLAENEERGDKNTKVTAAPEFEFTLEQNVWEAVQKSQLESGEVDDQAIHHKVLSEEIIAEECLVEQLKMETVPLPETKAVPEEKGHKAQDDEFQSELIKDVEQIEVNEDDVQLIKAEEISECRFTEKPVTCQVQHRTLSLTEANVETIKQDMKNVDAAPAKPQETIELVQSTDEIVKKIEAETLSTQRESYKVNVHLFDTKEEAIFAEETKTEYPKDISEVLPTVDVEPENEGQKSEGVAKTEITQEKVDTNKEQEATESISEEGTVAVEETEPVKEMIVQQEDQEAVDVSKNEFSQEIEVPKDGEATKLESDDKNSQASTSEVESKNIYSDEKARGHFNEDIRSLAENNEAQEDKNTKVTAALEFEFNQEQKVLKAAQKSRLESGEVDDQAIHHKVLSEEIIAEECLVEQLKMETVPLPETKAVPEEKGHKAQDDEFQSELIKDVEQIEVNEDDVQLVQAEEISECRLTENPVKCQVQDRSVSLTEVNVETIKQDMKNVDAAPAKPQETIELVQSTDEIVIKIEAEALSTERNSEIHTHLFHTREEAIFAEKTKMEGPKEKDKVPPTVNVEPDSESVDVAKTELKQEQTVGKEDIAGGITEEETVSVEGIIPLTEMNATPQDQDQEAVYALSIEFISEGFESEENEEFYTPEITEELDTFAAEHVSIDKVEINCAQILEQVIYKENAASCGDLEVGLSDMGSTLTEEKGDLRDVEMRTDAHLKEVSSSLAALVEKTSFIDEPFISSLTNQPEETAVTETQLRKDNITETAQRSNEVTALHVIEDDHRMQVQVVDVGVTSGKRIVDSTVEVAVKEDKPVMAVCHRNIDRVENVSASFEVTEVSNEKKAVTLQRVVQHMKRTQTRTLPESVNDNLRENVFKKEPDEGPACQSENLTQESHQKDVQQSVDLLMFQEGKNKDVVGKSEVLVLVNDYDMNTSGTETIRRQTIPPTDPAVPQPILLKEQNKAQTSIPSTVETKEEEQQVVAQDGDAQALEVDEKTMLNEETLSQTHRAHRQKDTEPTKEGSDTLVVEESLCQIDLVVSCEETEVTKGFQAPVEEEPFSQINKVHSQKVTPITEKVVQAKVAEEPSCQIDTICDDKDIEATDESAKAYVAEEPLPQINLVDGQKETEVTNDDVQSLKAKEYLTKINTVDSQKEVNKDVKQALVDIDDNPQQTKITEISVVALETKEPIIVMDTKEPAEGSLFQTESLQARVAEDCLSESQTVTEVTEVGSPTSGTQQKTNAGPTQTKLPTEDVQTVIAEKSFTQIDTKWTEFTEEVVKAQELEEHLFLRHKDTGQTEEHVQVSEAKKTISHTNSVNILQQAVIKGEGIQTSRTQESLSTKHPEDTHRQTSLTEEHLQVQEAEQIESQRDAANIHQQAEKLVEPIHPQEVEESLSQTELAENQNLSVKAEEHDHATDPEESIYQETIESNQHTERDVTEEHIQELKAEESLSKTVVADTQKHITITEKHVQELEADETITQTDSIYIHQQAEQPEELIQVKETEKSLSWREPVDSQKLSARTEEHNQTTEMEEFIYQRTAETHQPTEITEGHFQAQDPEGPPSETNTVESHKNTVLTKEHVKLKTNKYLTGMDPVQIQKESELAKAHTEEREAEKPLNQTYALKRKKKVEVLQEHVLKLEEPISETNLIDSQKQTAQQQEHVQEPKAQTEQVEQEKQTKLPNEHVQEPEPDEPLSQKDAVKREKQIEVHKEHILKLEETVVKTNPVDSNKQKEQPQEPVQEQEPQTDLVEKEKQTKLPKKHVQDPELDKPISETEPIESNRQTDVTEEHFKERGTEQHLSQTNTAESHKQTERTEEHIQEPEQYEPLSKTDPFESHKNKVKHVEDKSISNESSVANQKTTELPKENVEKLEAERFLSKTDTVNYRKPTEQGLDQEQKAKESLSQTDQIESHRWINLPEEPVQEPETDEPFPQPDTVKTEKQMGIPKHHILELEEPVSKTDLVDSHKQTKQQPELLQEPQHQTHLLDKETQTELAEEFVQQPEPKGPLSELNTVGSKNKALTNKNIQIEANQYLPKTDRDQIQKETKVTKKHAQEKQSEEPLFKTNIAESQKQAKATKKHVPKPEPNEPLSKTDQFESHTMKDLTEEVVEKPEADKTIAKESPIARQKQTELPEVHVEKPETEEYPSETDAVDKQKLTDLPQGLVQIQEVEDNLSQTDPIESHRMTELPEECVQEPKAEGLPKTDSVESHKNKPLREDYIQPGAKEYLSETDSVQIPKATELTEKVQQKEAEEPVSSTNTAQNRGQAELNEGQKELLCQRDKVEIQNQTELTKEQVQEAELDKPQSETDPYESSNKKVLTEKHVEAPETGESISKESPVLSQKKTEVLNEHVEKPETKAQLFKTDAVDIRKQTDLMQGFVEEPKPQCKPLGSYKLIDLPKEHVQEPEAGQHLHHTDAVKEKQTNLSEEYIPELKESVSETDPANHHKQTEQHKLILIAETPTDLSERGTQTELLEEHVKEPKAQTDLSEREKHTDLPEEHVQEPEAETDLGASEEQTELPEDHVQALESERTVLQNNPSQIEKQTQGHPQEQETDPVVINKEKEKEKVHVKMSKTAELDSTETKNPPTLMNSAAKPTESLEVVEETPSTHSQIPEASIKEAEENKQDVWMNAEEGINIQEKAEASSFSDQPLQDPEAACSVSENLCENLSENLSNPNPDNQDSVGEDFAVALENTESVAAIERD
ncbi:titin [Nerophis ophidion]|uniref:titin n=1 Tax=Nerophis ophidion TaxID=159077 RepID=UPI002AE022DC|nr:titin [Nerophis ophidion]